MRLFTAIELPDAVKRQIDALTPPDRVLVAPRPEQRHLTLTFFGEIPAARLAEFRAALRRVRVTPFQLRLDGSGCFPATTHPRVFWCGVATNHELSELKNRIDVAAAPLMPPSDIREFIPHITLFRFKSRPAADLLARLSTIYRTLTATTFPVAEFMLLASNLTPQGAIHTVMERFPAASATNR
ncbi:MAG: RNA 2',3'-cyclic phosphodiesterase [Victivallales bacterium]|nr:RNA 2',3'-cyclic phosphodiesterase [Victivallales bacterium]